jgi:two-component system, NarL family, invasion response regulator UvrY
MINVLICDDHALIRQGLRQILADVDDLHVAAEAVDGPSAVRRVREGGIDVVLLDIALPHRDGLDVLKQLQDEHPKLPVLILSTYPEKQYAVRCLKLGAVGYLNKGTDHDQLVSAIRKVMQGGIYVSSAIAESLAAALRRDADRAPHETLSDREYQVFALIAAGNTLTHIARNLNLSLTTVSTYRSRILDKISVKNDVELALYAVRHQIVSVS